MQGHGLMQAIARVNRVFRDKPGGLVVDYLGLADQLKKALITYTESGGQGNPTFDTAQAIAVMLEKHGIACDIETISPDQINEAYERMLKSDVRYRFVIDMEKLAA